MSGTTTGKKEAKAHQIPDEFFTETFLGSELASSGLLCTVHIKAGCGSRGSRLMGDIKIVKNLKKYQNVRKDIWRTND